MKLKAEIQNGTVLFTVLRVVVCLRKRVWLYRFADKNWGQELADKGWRTRMSALHVQCYGLRRNYADERFSRLVVCFALDGSARPTSYAFQDAAEVCPRERAEGHSGACARDRRDGQACRGRSEYRYRRRKDCGGTGWIGCDGGYRNDCHGSARVFGNARDCGHAQPSFLYCAAEFWGGLEQRAAGCRSADDLLGAAALSGGWSDYHAHYRERGDLCRP